MLGEGYKSNSYFYDRCFSALGIFFVFTCASIFLAYFSLEIQCKVGKVSERYCSCVEETLRRKDYAFSLLRIFFCANVHFKAKPSKVVVEEGDPFSNVSPGSKNKCAINYMEHAEYIEENAKCEGAGSVAQ